MPALRWLFTTTIAGPDSVSTISRSPTAPLAKRDAILRACSSDSCSTGFGFSQSLAGLGGVWTEARLEQFIADPRAFAPGTAMEFLGIDNAADRAALLAYVRTLGSQSQGARAVGEAP